MCQRQQTVYTDYFDADSNAHLYMRTVAFSPDGKLLAGAGEDHHVRVWSVKSGKVQQRLTGHAQDVYSIKFSKDGRSLFSASGDRTVRMWDTGTWECVQTNSLPVSSNTPSTDSGFTSLALSPTGKYFATASLDRAVRVWEIESGEVRATCEGHLDAVYCVDFSPVDDSLLVSGSLDRTLRLWRFTTGEATVIPAHNDFVLAVVFTPDGRYFISGGKDRSINVWDVASHDQVLTLTGHFNSVICLAVTEGMLVSGSGDNKARLWSIYKQIN